MALLQIAEPGQSTAPHQHKHAIGIDLGTTNSLVATVRSGQSEVITDKEGVAAIPSVVQFCGRGQVKVGSEAVNNADLAIENTIFSVKRLLARSAEELVEFNLPYLLSLDDPQAPKIRTQAGDKSPVEVSAEILKVLYNRAEASLGEDVEGAVITVPAYFDDAQRQATKDAAHLAGINVLRLLNEPTAAAVAYGLEKKAEGVHVIYDLGGGTFDVSILNFSKGVFEVLATGGNSSLGGDDFDRKIADWLAAEMGVRALNKTEQQRLLMLARNAKERLSSEESVELAFQFSDHSWQGELNREKFSEIVKPLLDLTLRACKKTLRDAKITVDEIEDVVLVGGSTRSHIVRESVARLFGCEPLSNIDPDKVVALGAAIQADVLIGNPSQGDVLLLDVIPLSLGLEVMGGLSEKIIPRNTTIPVVRAQEFTTSRDGQTALSVHVVQGERELVDNCRSLADFVLRGIPPMAAGSAKILITFQVDADGLLSVAAKELISGVEAHVEVKPSYGLGEDQIAQMLQDSFAYAKEDSEQRALREQQVDGRRLIDAVKAALLSDGENLLCENERKKLGEKITILGVLLESSDRKRIKEAYDSLNHASEGFAALRMDASIKSALAGQNIDDV